MDSIADASGLKAAILNKPNRKETRITGVKNCQADTPADLVTTSSLLRVSPQNDAIPPNKTAKGKIFWAIKGNFIRPSFITNPRPTLSLFDALRSNSTISIRKITARKIIKIVKKLRIKFFAM